MRSSSWPGEGDALVLKRFPYLLTVPFLAVLLWAAIAAPAPAEAQEPETETITTLLYPGWNMVGWVGRPTPVRGIFEEIPELTHIYGWDTEAQRYRRSTPTSTGYRMSRAVLGQGLWFFIAGDAVVEWVRPVWDRYALLSVESGLNLTGWAGQDAEPIETALGRFGDRVTVAWRWDAEAQRFDVYVPGAGASSTLAELNRGDALLLELSEEASWWQSGFGNTTIAFSEEVTPERQEDVRSGLAEVVAFFAEQYGLHLPDFALRSEEDFPNQARTVFLGRPPGSRVQSSTVSIASNLTGFSLNRVLAHEYFHVLQHSLARYPYPPVWLTEGAATYAAALYEVTVGAQTGEEIRQDWWQVAGRVGESLSELESDFYGAAERYYLAAAAVDWLVANALAEDAGDSAATSQEPLPLLEQAQYDSFIEHYRLLRSLRSWQEAFEAAFGIDPEAFYSAFASTREEAAFESALRALFDIGAEEFTDDREVYREAAMRPLPHTQDDVIEPVAIFLGEVAPERQEAVRTRVKDVGTFLTGQLGADPYEYSVYVAADEESARPALYGLYRQGYLGSTFYCSFRRTPSYVFHTISCGGGDLSDRTLVRMAFAQLQPRTDSAGQPWWLRSAGHYYATVAFEAWIGESAYAEEIERLTGPAREMEAPLRQLETNQGWVEAGDDHSLALSLLAIDWLVNHAGERSLIEYYRLLPRGKPDTEDYEPGAGSWQAAFEQAFGLTPDDFYEQFEAYRAELTTP
ncbi:MAG: hypothetical protein F4Z77_03645 [Dehalococcoidia bacterium]|nr:hypothetical protein [Dehalococcoidia bacterium]MYA53854.1 hypothetical protein [Dehalococcoidia bacterium]